MSQKKPVGVDGSLTHETGLGVDKRTFNRHVEPKQKDLIEADIAQAFETRAGASKLVQLPENDLDFSWSRDGRDAKIEFTELVLAHPPYKEAGDSAVIQYKPWAEGFETLVIKKNGKRYGSKSDVDLLIYTTHFAYHGNEYCVALAAERLRRADAASGFAQVFYLEYRGEASTLHSLKPYRPAMRPSIRREYERLWYSNMNFARGTAVKGGTRFEVELPPRE